MRIRFGITAVEGKSLRRHIVLGNTQMNMNLSSIQLARALKKTSINSFGRGWGWYCRSSNGTLRMATV